MFYIALGDSGTGVGHVKCDVVAVWRGTQGHLALLRRELERVTNQVADDLSHAVRIGTYGDVVWRRHRIKLNAALGGNRAKRLLRLLEDRFDRDFFQIEREFAGL